MKHIQRVIDALTKVTVHGLDEKSIARAREEAYELSHDVARSDAVRHAANGVMIYLNELEKSLRLLRRDAGCVVNAGSELKMAIEHPKIHEIVVSSWRKFRDKFV